ncbi:MAG: RNA polymerase sigma factor WhiG [Treponema sp.]|nr:RNA polymerase sigma factor WhiG [Treponema sp.]
METAKSQFINDEEEDNLWNEYKKTRSSSLRETLIRKYMPLVKYVAGKVSVGLPKSMEFEDLVSFGNFGLIDAINKYDLDKNVKFKTYAVTRIYGSIYDEMRQLDWVPRSVRTKNREIENAISELEAKLSRPATDAEVAKHLNMTEDEYRRTLQRVSAANIVSINDPYYMGDDSEHVTIENSLESPSSLNPDIQVEKEEIRKVIIQAINELPEREKMVIVLYYHEDLTFKEIGQVLEVSESRISQLHSNANLHLRAKLTNFRKGIF